MTFGLKVCLFTTVNFGFSFGLLVRRFIMNETPALIETVEKVSRKRLLGDDADVSITKKLHVESDRVKRKKVAMLIAYSGQGYLGMQRNPGMRTIEEDLLCAMLKIGLITEDAFTTPQYIQFQRAARTDKGVSAARQVVSIKLPEDVKLDGINTHLPDQIRVLDIKRTTKGFNSKSSCDARTYSYMLPTFAFMPPGEELMETYRISSEVIAEVNSTLKLFEGTHNFHNFTSRKKPMDPSAHRYMMSFECGKPFLSGDLEFSVIKVKGQSFMLHQIRKMIGLTIAIARGHTTTDTISKAWKLDRLDIPVAPGLGLVLEEVHYDRYNQRFGSDGIHEPLDWSEVDETIKAFKEKYIYPTIVETESKEKSMFNWLLTLPFHSYDIREDNLTNDGAKSSDIVEDEDLDGLSTLARAAVEKQEERDNNVLQNGIQSSSASAENKGNAIA